MIKIVSIKFKYILQKYEEINAEIKRLEEYLLQLGSSNKFEIERKIAENKIKTYEETLDQILETEYIKVVKDDA